MKKGDTVTIMNLKLDGEEFIEGDAVLVRELESPYAGTDYYVPLWKVRFLPNRPGDPVVSRYLWPPEEVERVRTLEELAPDLSA